MNVLYKATEFVPGDTVTAINKDLVEGTLEHHVAGDQLHMFGGPFEDGFRMLVLVIAAESGPASISLRLHDAEDREVRSENCLAEPLDQEYEIAHADHVYRYTIERAAVVHLTDEMANAYVLAGKVCCPHCGCDDINQSSKYTVEGGITEFTVTCCACNARWRRRSALALIEPIDAPTMNVPELETQEEQ